MLKAENNIIKNINNFEKHLADQDPHKKTNYLKKW